MQHNNKYNLWFQSLDFAVMERLTHLRQSNFSHENGYQDFVDACEQWWHETPHAEKEYIYNCYHYNSNE